MVVFQRAKRNSECLARGHGDRAAGSLLHGFAAERVGDEDTVVAVVARRLAVRLAATATAHRVPSRRRAQLAGPIFDELSLVLVSLDCERHRLSASRLSLRLRLSGAAARPSRFRIPLTTTLTGSVISHRFVLLNRSSGILSLAQHVHLEPQPRREPETFSRRRKAWAPSGWANLQKPASVAPFRLDRPFQQPRHRASRRNSAAVRLAAATGPGRGPR